MYIQLGLLGQLMSYKKKYCTCIMLQQNNLNENVLAKHTLGLLGQLTSYKKVFEIDSMLQQNSSVSQHNKQNQNGIQTQFKINSIFRIIKIVNIEDMHSVAKHPAYLSHYDKNRGDCYF